MTATQALTDPVQMRQWWGIEEGFVEERADGVWAVAWNDAEAPRHEVLCGTIRSLRHSSHLHVQRMVLARAGRPILGPMSFTFEARERGNTTHLTVAHEGFGAGDEWDAYRQVAVATWPRDLARLKAFLERPR
ncbi:MAG: SRPBCC domain-containing protein [Planctomycetota bacterium]